MGNNTGERIQTLARVTSLVMTRLVDDPVIPFNVSAILHHVTTIVHDAFSALRKVLPDVKISHLQGIFLHKYI